MKILYIYDFENWALHNVGLYWANLVKDAANFIFTSQKEYKSHDPRSFDYIFWGCTHVPERRLKELWHKLIPSKSPAWAPECNRHFISVIHDPCEIFPQKEDWKLRKPRLHRLKLFSKLAVTSGEMQKTMFGLGYRCPVISTNSKLALRNSAELKHEPLKVFTKSYDHPRKNLALFRNLQRNHSKHCASFDGYIGRQVLPESDYLNLIDRYNCYICTSWQEGGPIPLMDAMRRGCAVLTTHVGQTDELIREGHNGFFCKNEKEFAARIECLASNPDLLYEMRLNSLRISAQRSESKVRRQLMRFLMATTASAIL
jgi:hypothetical protein